MMKKIFGFCLLTEKDIAAINSDIQALAKTIERRTEKQRAELGSFQTKFDAAMDFIGRNLPLKRKRKAFFKIVK